MTQESLPFVSRLGLIDLFMIVPLVLGITYLTVWFFILIGQNRDIITTKFQDYLVY